MTSFPGTNPVTKTSSYKTITDRQQISSIVDFVNQQTIKREGWHIYEPAISQREFLTLAFFEDEIYRGSFGIGEIPTNSEYFFTAFDDNGSRKKLSTPDEREKMLKLIGLTEQEYLTLKRNWYKQVFGS